MTIFGIDISKYQKNINWRKVKDDEISFVIIKATQKDNSIEPSFESHYKGAMSEDIKVGVYKYVYAKNTQEAIKEANAVVDVLTGKTISFGVWLDMEDASIKHLGKQALTNIIDTEAKVLKDAGYDVGIYCNEDWYKNVLDGAELSKRYPMWIARYGKNNGLPDFNYEPKIDNIAAWQYTSKGMVDGIQGHVDVNIIYNERPFQKTIREDEIKMDYKRDKVVKVMAGWIGRKESDGSHKDIIDLYNSISPLPVGYKVKYTDSWCAATVSAAFHQLGYDSIFPLECSCNRMIEKAKKMGIWMESDNYIPKPGDAILYDWQDNGIGDNVGTSEHVGIVESVSGNNITVIEGNKNDSVDRRTIKVDGKYIRGFVVPKFDESANSQPQSNEVPPSSNTTTQQGITKPAPSYKNGKVYTLQVNLNVRVSPAGEKKKYSSLTADGRKNGVPDKDGYGSLKKGTKATCLSTTKLSNGDIWMQIPSGWVCAKKANGTVYVA